MSALAQYRQHPLDVRRRRIDWSARSAVTQIDASSWEGEGLTLTGEEIDDKLTVVFVDAGGEAGEFRLTNRIEHPDGKLDQSILVVAAEEALKTINLDPDAEETHTFDWRFLLGAATIDSSTFLLPDEPDSALTQMQADNTDTTTLVKLTGGTRGQTYRVLNRVVTSEGETIHLPIDFYITDA